MSMNYREKVQFSTSSEEETTSSSSDDDTHVILDILASPSSKYFVKSILGEGSFGTVTKCIKAATKGTVAVKIMKQQSLTAEAQNEMAILEHLRAFDSDRFNFVKWNDGFIDREHLCLEFEMLDISLFDFVQKKHTCCLSVKEIRPILHQVATTLEFLRTLGLVHSDLKPDNIMMVDHVNQPLKVKMIDFGLARHVSQSQWGSYLQPRYYRSPEVILGLPYTAAIDIWSLGCIAAELFLGNVLYPGDSEYDMLRHITQTQGQLPQDLLNNGLKTQWFFRRKVCRQRQWTLKTPFEYGRAVFTETHFNSLDDLKKVKPVCHLSAEDNTAEIADRENFVDLLKKMLQLDVSKRITPSQILEDLFITMNELTDRYPNSLYVKSSCEMMQVCQDQQPCLSPQASTSTSTISTAPLDQSISRQPRPAWHRHKEHPLIQNIASAISSSLSMHDDILEPRQISFSVNNERTQPEHRLPVSSKVQCCAGRDSLTRKRSRDTSESSTSSERSTKGKMNMDFFETLKSRLNYGSIGQSINPESKRPWDTLVTAQSCNRSSGSPERERRMKDGDQTPKELPQNTNKTPAEATSSATEAKHQRKRTFVASHSGTRTPRTGSPKRKRMRMDHLHDSKETPSEVQACVAEVKPQKKRKRDTFTGSHLGSPTSPDSSSPKRKRMRMDPEEVEKKTKVSNDSHQASSNMSKESQRDEKNPDCSSPDTTKKRKRKQKNLDGP